MFISSFLFLFDVQINNKLEFRRESQTLTMDEIKKKIDAIEERNPDEPFSVVEIIKSFMDRKQGDGTFFLFFKKNI